MSEKNVLSLDFHKKYPKVAYGKGIYMYTEDGVELIDGASGPVLASLGHGVPEMAEVLKEQALKIAYAHRDDCTSEVLEQHCRMVADLTNNDMGRIFEVCGGSEANEIAIKLVRKYQILRGKPSKYKIIGRWQSYHGMTNGALSVSGFAKRRAGYEPYLHEFGHIAPAYCYRCWFGKEEGSCNFECAQALENEILNQGPDAVAAFIMEPVSGMSLCAAAPAAGYFKEIRRICDKYDVLLMMDEVMSGVGRTGLPFAYQRYGIKPDVVTMGKALSGGYFPLAAVGISEAMYKSMDENGGNFPPGFSWSASPLGAAVGIAALDYLKDHKLIEQCAARGEYLKAKLEGLKAVHPTIGDVRGMGLMIGIELVKDKATKESFPPSVGYSGQVADECLRQNMLIESSAGCNKGQSGDTLMLAPAFIVSEAELDKIVERLDGVLTIVEKNNGF